MTKFLIRRFISAIVVVTLGALIIYTIMRMMPITYVEAMAREMSSQPNAKPYQEWLDQLNRLYGLDSGILQGFFTWASHAVRLDFGDSWFHTVPVVQKFNEVVWVSAIIAGIAMLFELLTAIPLGILAARKQYSKTDYAVTVFALMGISLPSFFFASVLRYVFAIKLPWFEVYGFVSRNYPFMTPFQQFTDKAWHLVLPVATLMMLSIGGLMRYTRTNMLEVLNSDYIRTARAKGLPESKVINSHAFRNTLIPLVTFFNGLLPAFFGGALITEQIFAIPGIGYTAYLSLVRGDIPFTMFYMVFMIILAQVSFILADIMYAVVDPRVRIN